MDIRRFGQRITDVRRTPFPRGAAFGDWAPLRSICWRAQEAHPIKWLSRLAECGVYQYTLTKWTCEVNAQRNHMPQANDGMIGPHFLDNGDIDLSIGLGDTVVISIQLLGG